eukprot:TRINITY_DN37656_c0_g1_i1.p2 TRINITY_DN37656_c0_g1~~TRINITY_DN37656_c0_g1_i1.p2  ORF type:complete len:127 (-),score=38.12 TRINITY_DN37656_c0_g1_i1:68-448(-)
MCIRDRYQRRVRGAPATMSEFSLAAALGDDKAPTNDDKPAEPPTDKPAEDSPAPERKRKSRWGNKDEGADPGSTDGKRKSRWGGGEGDGKRKSRWGAVSYTHLRAHETPEHLVCRLLLEKKKNITN